MDTLFYDGDCGLCHRAVLFALRHDPEGVRFRYAPIASETFVQAFSDAVRRELPDSVIVKTSDGRTLTRWAAVQHIAERAGGRWGALARTAGILPHWLLNWGYDRVARVRRHLFAKPAGACPILPAELRGRFLP
ncbi:MAG TPA: DCC1-like thiol-disulfide oxidoreductase family protein [Gemmatimonadales bacterium]|nr:DCC1-like thiol-disulfide oxidoreductase family protein [Gemmatimonadales bacterium]